MVALRKGPLPEAQTGLTGSFPPGGKFLSRFTQSEVAHCVAFAGDTIG